MNNEDEIISRSRKRRNERKIKMDDQMKSLLSKIKREKKRETKNIDKIKQLEIALVKIKYVNNPSKINTL